MARRYASHLHLKYVNIADYDIVISQKSQLTIHTPVDSLYSAQLFTEPVYSAFDLGRKNKRLLSVYGVSHSIRLLKLADNLKSIKGCQRYRYFTPPQFFSTFFPKNSIFHWFFQMVFLFSIREKMVFHSVFDSYTYPFRYFSAL